MKKTTLAFSALTFSLGLAFGPMTAYAAESAAAHVQQMPSLAPMLEKVMPAVVSIYVEGSQEVQQQMPPQFQQFFGENSPFCMPDSPFGHSPFCQPEGEDGPKEQQKFQALGAGVIIDAAKGFIVTNNHLAEHADKISVQMSDGRKFDAKVIGKDARTDLALLQLKDAKNLTAITLADSDSLKVGDYTVAIGNPFGLGETATSGIISALGRSGLNTDNYENFIQTDAAINRGNSGGALINLKGELIGINTAILAPDGGNVGIGFAIPSNMVKNLVKQFVEYGQVRRGELGIVGTELNADLAKALKVNEQKGAFVSQVVPDSAAAKSGVKAGDIIVSLNGKPVSSFATFRAEVASLPVGSKLTLGLLRDGKPLSLEATLAQSSKGQMDAGNMDVAIEGAELSNAQLGKDKVVRVESVKEGSAAQQLGLKKGDFILAGNQQKIESLGDLRKILESKPSVLVLKIRRGETDLFLMMH